MSSNIIVPRDVWKLIIDKLEPDFVLPKFLGIRIKQKDSYSTRIINTHTISEIYGPDGEEDCKCECVKGLCKCGCECECENDNDENKCYCLIHITCKLQNGDLVYVYRCDERKSYDILLQWLSVLRPDQYNNKKRKHE